MNGQALERFRNVLTQLQDRLRVDGTAATKDALEWAQGELSHVPLHLGDMGSDEFLRDVSAVLAENEGYLASEVRDALKRIAQGTYGQCENCGKSIAGRRLKAIPFARYCLRCASELNSSPAGSIDDGRPHKPKDTLAPEGGMAEDRRRRGRRGDVHAAGDAGGGTAWGGLAGSNRDHGDPFIANLQDAVGSGNTDASEERFRSRGHVVEPIEPLDVSDKSRKQRREE